MRAQLMESALKNIIEEVKYHLEFVEDLSDMVCIDASDLRRIITLAEAPFEGREKGETR